MKKGYVKVYRQIKNTSVWADPNKLKLWLYCLMEASYDDHEVFVGAQRLSLKKGQFITGRNQLEKDFNVGCARAVHVSGSTLVRWLKLFEKSEMLNIKNTNKYSIVTVLNWDKYQNDEHQMNIKCTTDEHQMNIKCTTDEHNKRKERKGIKEKKEINTMLGADPTTPIIRFVLDTGEEFVITEKQFQEWQRLVPDVNVRSELNRMKLWLENNPEKRKSASSMKRFITNWLSKEQKEAERFKSKANAEGLPNWYKDTEQTEPTPELLKEIKEIKKEILSDKEKTNG